MPAPVRGEEGYALVSAVAAIALCAAVALAMVTATRIALAGGDAEITRARAQAAADAGIAIALHGLTSGDAATLSALDGRVLSPSLPGARLAVRIIDERGKVPINRLEEEQVSRVLEVVGLSGEPLLIARDSLEDWLDDDDLARTNGAEAAWYAPQGIAPRNGALQSVDELARVRGFSPALVERLRPFITTDPDATSFDPTHAQLLALAAMSQGEGDAASQIIRARENSGQRTALDFVRPADVIGRPLTIAADADLPGGGHARREALIEVTQAGYLVRSWR